MTSSAQNCLKSLIRTVADFPKPGIQFRDITSLLGDASGFRMAIDCLGERYRNMGINRVAAIESRGFIVGAPLAVALGVGLVPIRKPGKLPAASIGIDYQLEYGHDRLEMHIDAINAGERIVLVDDLIATGGTALAAASLITQTGGQMVECAFVVDLPDLGGRTRLEAAGFASFALCEFDGD